MKLTEYDLEKSIGGVLSRFGIDKDEARKAGRQLSSRIGEENTSKSDKKTDERFNVYFLGQFAMVDTAIEDALMPTLTVTEQAIYRRLYRLSFGYGRTWCQISQSEISKSCNISSIMTERKGLRGLEDSHCIKVIKPSIQRKAPIYRVYLPCEMPQFEGTDIKTGAVFLKEKIDIQELRELINSTPNFSSLNWGIRRIDVIIHAKTISPRILL